MGVLIFDYVFYTVCPFAPSVLPIHVTTFAV